MNDPLSAAVTGARQLRSLESPLARLFGALVVLSLAACGVIDGVETDSASSESAALSTPNAPPIALMAQRSVAQGTGLTVNASGRKWLFQTATSPRVFATLKALGTFAESSLGASNVNVIAGSKTTSITFKYANRQLASSYVRDATRGLSYAVKDPLLATLGGTTGQIILGSQTLCIDPDGSCIGVPSYLQPLLTPTADSHVNGCAGELCMQYHSFFNKVDLGFFRYARHGANTRMTRGSAAATSRLERCGGAGAASPTEAVSSIRVTMRTGGDDLRGNSHVYLQLGLPGFAERSLNGGAGLGGGSVVSYTVPLPAGTTAGAIASVGLRFHSGDCLFCTTDNWNLDDLNVELMTPTGAVRSFVRRIGTPLVRFTGSTNRYTLETGTTGDATLCSVLTPALTLTVDASRLVKFVDYPWMHWEALALPGVSGTGLDMVETAYGGVSIGVRVSGDGSFTPGSAPSFSELESDGICSSHSGPAGWGQTGNGNHAGAEAAGLCP